MKIRPNWLAAWLTVLVGVGLLGWGLVVVIQLPVGENLSGLPAQNDTKPSLKGDYEPHGPTTRRETPTIWLQPTQALPTATAVVNPCLAEMKPGSFVGGLVPAQATGQPSPAPTVQGGENPRRPYSRAGVGVSAEVDVKSVMARLGAGWYLDWQVHDSPKFAGIEHWQTVRVSEKGSTPSLACVQYIARRYSGQIWIIGNEPDVIWQDNITPEGYARLYGQLYRGIKTVDPTAKVAVGGIAAVTPLRLAYLERVLAAYEREFGGLLPVDWWTVHVYVLREERGSWGIEIPPGMSESSGRLYEVSDHARLDLFEAQVREFRGWMAQRGYREIPLAVTEFGLLMPNSYGFPPDKVAGYLKESFELLDSMKNPKNGMPGDENRLVQRWAWFSLADIVYPTANLVAYPGSGLTINGAAFQEFVRKRE